MSRLFGVIASAFRAVAAYAVFATTGSNTPRAYPWSEYWGTVITGPSPLPASEDGFTTSPKWSPTNDYVAFPGQSYLSSSNPTPFGMLPWNGSSFGTKISAPNMSTYNTVSVAWTSSTPRHILIGDITPNIRAYPFTSSYGTVLTAISPALAASPSSAELSPAGTHVAMALGTDASVPLTAYAWNSGFGTKVANPASPPTDSSTGFYCSGQDLQFHPSGSHVVWGGYTNGTKTSSEVIVYAWSNGFGTRLAAPAVFPNYGLVFKLDFHPDGTYLAASAFEASNSLWVWPWSNGVLGTRLAVGTPPGNAVRDVKWSPSGTTLLTGNAYAYPFTNGALGTPLAQPPEVNSNALWTNWTN